MMRARIVEGKRTWIPYLPGSVQFLIADVDHRLEVPSLCLSLIETASESFIFCHIGSNKQATTYKIARRKARQSTKRPNIVSERASERESDITSSAHHQTDERLEELGWRWSWMRLFIRSKNRTELKEEKKDKRERKINKTLPFMSYTNCCRSFHFCF